jgi:hypothetical protein
MDAQQNFHLRHVAGDGTSLPSTRRDDLDSLYDARAAHAYQDEDARMSRGLAELSERVGPTHRDVAELAQDLARIHYEDENLHKALYLFERAWSIWRVVDGKAGPNTLVCQQELALCLHRDGQHMRADALLDAAMAGMDEVAARYDASAAREAGLRREEEAQARAASEKASEGRRSPPGRRRKRSARGSDAAARAEAVPPRTLRGTKEPAKPKPPAVPIAPTRHPEKSARVDRAAAKAPPPRRRAPLVKTTRGGPPWRPAGGVTQTGRANRTRQAADPFAWPSR